MTPGNAQARCKACAASRRLPTAAPETGEPFDAILRDLDDVLLPALALSEGSSSIQAIDSGGYHYWSPMQVSVGAGATVTFANPSQVSHGVEWISGPATPACSGVPVGTTPTVHRPEALS